ncbi:MULTISPECIES: NADPH:quinone oxidoreductase family protein [unclassified Mycolicibacterium]|uniref:NADPH:quinone oxidoreductase family protein n=1 Tax=unclassified Mycolicibacterium TaxID=2636767 RepID=UPI0013090D91|nr:MULTISPECIES: NADPH:quinone oxidoreductase family protein [unclassified Mycolicibacterium]MUL83362.1 NADPH:quinone oxidoreductase family protein [Mycolicibacterium sp. CBMA 329]MUL90353.1 NADPH:quinone oxidoreductase family protein [Mycolicibacterium sp. CBMA 331]MUM00327.1 NADPH:quinone oxidoreductase family protein [Mycolicibacterium sp. CBMA 334]MUM30058.1 NADPH:quinone oxidoreductase family protein [Mycolicibacterium sp. CBMA 295]MUM41297.1 NADPH:quinone oxidoreductase family protein [M
MKAAVCPEYGPPDVVRVEEIPTPPIASGEVRVQVGAAAVNFPDVLLVADRYQINVPVPFVPGSEFAGVVTEVAGATEGFTVGDRVTGTGLFGAFAEQVCVPTAGLARIPEGVDDRTAAAFGVAHRTAYHTLRSVARIHPGDDVIVLGAGGGVGLAAAQLGAALGARVTAVASSDEKLTTAAQYGAVSLVNHTRGDLRTALREVLPDGAHAVLDPVGGELSEPALRTLRRGGRFVTIGYASGVIPRIPLNLVLVKGIQVLGFQFQDMDPNEFARNEAELRELLAAGTIRPHIGAVYPLTETAAALREVASGKAVGKVVIEMR